MKKINKLIALLHRLYGDACSGWRPGFEKRVF